MRTRINNVFEKYIKNFKTKWYEDIYDIYDKCQKNSGDITKEQFEKYADRKINTFISNLYPELVDKLKDEKKVLVLCWYLKTALKNNLYNNNPSVFYLFDCLFQVPNEPDDHGFTLNFDIVYGTTFYLPGACLLGKEPEYLRSLIIEASFMHTQSEEQHMFQLRCHYDQFEGQYNVDFEKYFNNSDNFLTTEDIIDYAGGREYCDYDTFAVDIAEIPTCAELYTELVDKNDINNIIEEIKNVVE